MTITTAACCIEKQHYKTGESELKQNELKLDVKLFKAADSCDVHDMSDTFHIFVLFCHLSLCYYMNIKCNSFITITSTIRGVELISVIEETRHYGRRGLRLASMKRGRGSPGLANVSYVMCSYNLATLL